MRINHRVIIGLLLIWLTISLGLTIPTIKISSNLIITIKQTPGGVTQPPPSGSSAFLYVLEAIVWGIIALSIMGLLVYRKKILREAIQSLVSLILGFLLIGATLWLGNRVNLTPSAGGIEDSGSKTSQIIYQGNNLWIMLSMAIIFAITILVIWKTYRVEKETPTIKKSVKEYLEEAIYQVKIGKDVRGAILSAYLEMEKLMRSQGVEDKKYYTPREFQDFAVEQLRISPKPVNTLTELFEVARYSMHQMAEEDRDKALQALEEIRNEVGK